MINYELRRDEGILIITPEGPLSAADFETLGQEVDAYIVENGALMGFMIYVETFPGWEDFAGLISHLKFVKNNHQEFSKVAAVTDSKILSIMPHIVGHFIAAEVKHFDYDQKGEALSWLHSELAPA